jgi:Histidine kinase-like ATPase domain
MRAEVRRWLAPLALTGDAEDDLVLAVSEAATNCVEHAYIPATADDTVELTFWTEPKRSVSRSWTTACGRPRRTSPPAAAGESSSCSAWWRWFWSTTTPGEPGCSYATLGLQAASSNTASLTTRKKWSCRIEVGGYAEEPTEVRGWNVSYLDANGHIHDHMIPGARGDIACAVQRARELLNGLPAWAFRQ